MSSWKRYCVLFAAILLSLTSLRVDAQPEKLGETKDAADRILDSLFEASQNAQESWDAKQSELKDKLNARIDDTKSTLSSALSSVGSLASSTADLVADTTKLVAQFLTEDLATVEDVKESFQASATGLASTVSTLNGMVSKFAMMLHTAVPKLPSWDTIKNPKEWPQSLMTYTAQVSEAFSELAVETTKVYDGIEAKYCTPAKLAPSIKKQGKVMGPSFLLRLSSGECEFSHTQDTTVWNKETEVVCATPSLLFEKKPVHYISKHHSPVKFKSKECKREHELGEEREIVLFEINQGLDISSALQQASQRIQESFDGIMGEHENIKAELKNFADNMVADMDEMELSETVAKYDQAALDVASAMADGIVSFTTGSGQTFSNAGVRSLPGGWTVNMNADFEE